MKNSKSKLLILSFAFLVCGATANSKQSRNSGIPRDWKKVNFRSSFTFYLPPNAWDTGRSGLDELYKEYRIRRMAFTFIYQPRGVTSYRNRERTFGKTFEESVISVGGKKAYLYNYVQNWKGRKRYHTAMYVGDFPNGKVELWMTADSWRSKDLEIARKVFYAVEFIQP